ncbi:MAG: redoxin family protein [Armatimonadota bacterium]
MKLSRCLAISSLTVLTALSADQGLNIGDKAPKLPVTKWVKGSAQTLGNGKVSVVEFWATWCGPCRQSIPHLTELAHKYKGKVNFVGVSIWEHQPSDYTTAVPAFVKDFGAKMDYNVATEGPGAFMAKNWMTAAGENGIPTAFVINQQGVISWIGHPMDNMDKAIDATLSGKVNLATARTARAKSKGKAMEDMRVQQAMIAKITPITKDLQAKQWQAASMKCDKLMPTIDAKLKPTISQFKLMAMVQGNLKGLDSYITTLGNEPFAKDPAAMNQMLWSIVEKDLKLAPSAYASAAKFGQKMVALAPKNGAMMDTYALALWRAGDKAKALDAQRKAVALSIGDKTLPAGSLKDMKARLKQFGG